MQQISQLKIISSISQLLLQELYVIANPCRDSWTLMRCSGWAIMITLAPRIASNFQRHFQQPTAEKPVRRNSILNTNAGKIVKEFYDQCLPSLIRKSWNNNRIKIKVGIIAIQASYIVKKRTNPSMRISGNTCGINRLCAVRSPEMAILWGFFSKN